MHDYMTKAETRDSVKAMSNHTILTCKVFDLSVDLDMSLRACVTYALRYEYEPGKTTTICVRSYERDFEMVHGMIADRAVMALKDYVCARSTNVQNARKAQGFKAFEVA